MQIEYRILSNDIEGELFNNPVIDEYSCGSESCVHKIPDEHNLIYIWKELRKAKKGFNLVLPKIPEKHTKKILRLLDKLKNIGDDYSLTCNDLGIIHAAKKIDSLPDDVRIGRGISRSFGECLWSEHILRSELPENKEMILQNNIYDDNKKKILDSYGVKEIECNQLKTLEKSYKYLRNMNYKIALHYGYSTVAFSRACQTAKYFKTDTGKCSQYCETPICIDMKKIWTRNISLVNSEQDINDKLEKYNPVFFLIGNTLIRKADSNVNLTYIDRLIFDSRFYQVFDTVRIVKEIKNGKD